LLQGCSDRNGESPCPPARARGGTGAVSARRDARRQRRENDRKARPGVLVCCDASPLERPRFRWYADTFKVESDGGDVVFAEDFRLRFSADGTKSKFGCLGVGVEVADAPALDGVGGERKQLDLVASMVPDEDPELETLVDVAELEDPAGYTVWATAAVDAPAPSSPAPKVVLLVKDLDASIEFYTTALGMTLLRKRALLPHAAAMSGFVGFSDATDGPEGGASGAPRVELRYNYNNDKVDPDVSLAVVADAKACAIRAGICGGTVAGQADGTATLADPDGYTIVVADDAASL